MIFPSDFIQVTRKPIPQRIGNLSPAEGRWQLRLAVVHELHGMKTVICGHFWIAQGYPRIDMDWYGGTPIAGWFMMENHGKPFTKMHDLGWFGGTRILGNLHLDGYFLAGGVLKALTRRMRKENDRDDRLICVEAFICQVDSCNQRLFNKYRYRKW